MPFDIAAVATILQGKIGGESGHSTSRVIKKSEICNRQDMTTCQRVLLDPPAGAKFLPKSSRVQWSRWCKHLNLNLEA